MTAAACTSISRVREYPTEHARADLRTPADSQTARDGEGGGPRKTITQNRNRETSDRRSY